MPKRLTERYDVQRIRLRPETNAGDQRLVAILETLSPGGTTWHVLAQTPDNDSELFVVLVDDQAVVSFDLPRAGGGPEDVKIYTLGEYRRIIGQGRNRILLDRAAQLGRSG